LKAGEFFQRLDLFLKEAAVDKGKNVEHGESKKWPVAKSSKGRRRVLGSFRTMGRVLSAFESYQLGVVSTAMCLQNECLDYRT
jgi:hypothetical protein